MGKVGKGRNKDIGSNPKKRTRHEKGVMEDDMDDEIDVFHKQRDIIPLDINGDIDTSDEDNEQPVFDFENDDDDDDDDGDEGEEEEDDDDDAPLTGLGRKILRTQNFLRQKLGGVEDDDVPEEKEEDEDEIIWDNKYGAENIDYDPENSDDNEDLILEEQEVKRMLAERAKKLEPRDFGFEDSDEDEDISSKAIVKKSSEHKGDEETLEFDKDLNSVSLEEQMDVLDRNAPELVDLLADLSDAVDQLENNVNPLLNKAKGKSDVTKGGIRYLEVKQHLLLLYCQAISFYLVLRSEGHQVHDHPVQGRLVEIKTMLENMKELDGNLPLDIEELLNEYNGKDESGPKLVKESALLTFAPQKHYRQLPRSKAEKLVETVDLSMDNKNKEGKRKRETEKVGLQSVEMLKVRAALEEKLKQKGTFSSVETKAGITQKHPSRPVNKLLQTFDDFGDEITAKGNGHANSLRSSISQHLQLKGKKSKVNPGDEDITRRDDIGERRRKHELRVLAQAGVNSMDEVGDELKDGKDMGDDESMDVDNIDEDEAEGSEDDFYKLAKSQRAAKQSAKEMLYPSRIPAVPSVAQTEIVDGKRQINRQIEKNRGLTRSRNKLIKNPRKKYRLNHKKAVERRKGQVRDVKLASGPYGGEVSGINAGVSRSIRFKS
ncbi:hypothetical protein GIB67_000538 [Kingdonia uniflora]|uniref:Sas10 C-terminal domain-containing protein n=1 Tax=Kingdonia uniflora TaxID=39325 RepID=A0A7J7MIP7_9MAGN|nr:hypothetical protein GIB67_000538 [Kingdonia uniflora]